ncbi:MAG TPA: 16S rRNA (adenine(1518)-N(6)/adenine(1519)-N(6))-dimethyltransferase RsmA [Candidatus Bathyarchaeia archaeon]|nr:16S rRNA (adenine(1518)-N(6)/adenine(1519)-N(6))-dimethyltransferase RsmA [Candidatus Bathyarchaeia archaeon]
MSVEETKRLLRRFRIVPNRLLGQNFMVEPSVFPLLSDYASLGKADVVLDAGAGFGFLTRFLAKRCKEVVAVEKDPQVAEVLREQLGGLANVTIVEGDVLKAALPEFSKVVSIPPYYLSSRLVTWLLERKVECAVLVLQKEFANRLVAAVGSEDYGWLTVVAHCVEVELFDAVPKEMFYPQPEVDSVIVRLVPWKTAPFEVKDKAFFRRMVQWLFTERNKKLSNALVPFIKSTFKVSKEEAKKRVCTLPFGERRARELSPKDFGALANALTD